MFDSFTDAAIAAIALAILAALATGAVAGRRLIQRRRIVARILTEDGYTLTDSGDLRMPDGARLTITASRGSVIYTVHWIGSPDEVLAHGLAADNATVTAQLRQVMQQNRTLEVRANERRARAADYRARLVAAGR